MWDFMPMPHHFDSGFGAMGESFEEAANRLEEGVKEKSFLNWQVTVCFLRRHAIELFLKSLIIILGKKFGNLDDIKKIEITIDGRPRSITNIHAVSPLFMELKERLNKYDDKLKIICRTDWSSLPPDLESFISKIETWDERGTFFRYPDLNNTNDERKSMFQKSDIASIMASASPEKPPLKIFLLSNDKDEIVDSYLMNRDTLAEELACLQEASDILSNAHFGLRMELTNGA